MAADRAGCAFGMASRKVLGADAASFGEKFTGGDEKAAPIALFHPKLTDTSQEIAGNGFRPLVLSEGGKCGRFGLVCRRWRS